MFDSKGAVTHLTDFALTAGYGAIAESIVRHFNARRSDKSAPKRNERSLAVRIA
jgi:hypothetical protein